MGDTPEKRRPALEGTGVRYARWGIPPTILLPASSQAEAGRCGATAGGGKPVEALPNGHFSRPATPSRHENRPHRDMRPLRAGAERTIEAPWKAVANAIDPLEPDECKNRFTACVYGTS